MTVFPTDLRLKYVSSGNTLTVDDVEYPGPAFEIGQRRKLMYLAWVIHST